MKKLNKNNINKGLTPIRNLLLNTIMNQICYQVEFDIIYKTKDTFVSKLNPICRDQIWFSTHDKAYDQIN